MTIEQMLEGCSAILKGTRHTTDPKYPSLQYHVRREGSNTFYHGDTIIEALRAAYAAVPPEQPGIYVRHLTAEQTAGRVVTVTPVDDDLFGDDNPQPAVMTLTKVHEVVVASDADFDFLADGNADLF